MRHFWKLLVVVAAVCATLSIAVAAAPTAGPVEGKEIPPFANVEKIVLKYFEEEPDYRSGDLITREEVEPLLAQLQKQGLPLTDTDEILARVPAKDEFLVKQLSTPQGRKFMRRIATYPLGYDRVDRLSRLPQGHETVRMLVADPRGDRMIQYMTTTRGGRNLGKMLSNDPGGANFNAPTGRIYTVPMLLARLEESREAAVKAADAKSKKARVPQ